MPDVPQSAPQDLDRFSEALRRWLYDRVVQIQFGGSDAIVPYGPEEAELQVLCLGGRWFAVWMNPEEPPTVPLRLRLQIMRILASSENPAEIELYAI